MLLHEGNECVEKFLTSIMSFLLLPGEESLCLVVHIQKEALQQVLEDGGAEHISGVPVHEGNHVYQFIHEFYSHPVVVGTHGVIFQETEKGGFQAKGRLRPLMP